MGHFNAKDEGALLSLMMEKFDLDANQKTSAVQPDQLILDEVYHKIKQSIRSNNHSEEVIKSRSLWPRFAAAASVVILISIGFYLYHHQNTVPKDSFVLGTAKDIPPGKNTATLTLANGKVINLSDAKAGVVVNAAALTYSDGTEVGDSKPLAGFQTIATPRGGIYQIVLPDGTKVWLNAASSLKFPSNFNGAVIRKVELNGEAYFEVTKNKKQPFVVRTAKQELTVLGTHFTINSYPDEHTTRTTLLEGSVKIIAGHAEKILKPGQQSILTANDIEISNADIEEVMAWKNGDFVFKSENLESILRQVSRWYDVELIYAADAPKKLVLWGYISRLNNISAVLSQLERTGKVHFKVEGKRIMITK